MGALVLLQSLTSSPAGQAMVVQRRPDIIKAICQVARSEDEEAEGLRHAALRLLGGWHDDPHRKDGGDVIARCEA